MKNIPSNSTLHFATCITFPRTIVSLQILKKCTLWSYHAQLIKHKSLHCWMIIRALCVSEARLTWLLHAFTLPSIQQVSKINWKGEFLCWSISSSCIQGKNVKHNSLHHYLENWVLGKTNSTRIHSESLGIETEFFIKAAKVSNGSFTLDRDLFFLLIVLTRVITRGSRKRGKKWPPAVPKVCKNENKIPNYHLISCMEPWNE
jgi:hypothetical protein